MFEQIAASGVSFQLAKNDVMRTGKLEALEAYPTFVPGARYPYVTGERSDGILT